MKKSEKLLLEDRLSQVYSAIVKNGKYVDKVFKYDTPKEVEDAVGKLSEAIKACEVDDAS